MLVAVFVMYVILAILYESYLHPITVLSSLPVALLGGLLTLWLFGAEASLYAYIGMFMLMGIVKKNGIMIVDFAEQRVRQGIEDYQAIHDASMERFRPIMMTTHGRIARRSSDCAGISARMELPAGHWAWWLLVAWWCRNYHSICNSGDLLSTSRSSRRRCWTESPSCARPANPHPRRVRVCAAGRKWRLVPCGCVAHMSQKLEVPDSGPIFLTASYAIHFSFARRRSALPVRGRPKLQTPRRRCSGDVSRRDG